jgi:hypothetical protein
MEEMNKPLETRRKGVSGGNQENIFEFNPPFPPFLCVSKVSCPLQILFQG